MHLTAATALITSILVGAGHAHPGSGIATDAEGNVYFASGPQIVMIKNDGVARTIVNDRANEKFYQLHHIQHAPDGGLLTASDTGDVIWRFTNAGKLSRFYPPENEDRALRVGMGGDPFAVDKRGNVYVVNSVQNLFTQILQVNAEGRIRIIAGGEWGLANGAGANSKFGDLHGGSMLVTEDGALLLTEDGTRVRRINSDGMVSTLAGGESRGFADGPGKEARFDGARGIALDRDGNVLVAEASGRIRKISSAGIVDTLAGSGSKGGKDGPVLEATFDEPTGVAIAPDGDIFILEPANYRVRKISEGRVTTFYQGLPSPK